MANDDKPFFLVDNGAYHARFAHVYGNNTADGTRSPTVVEVQNATARLRGGGAGKLFVSEEIETNPTYALNPAQFEYTRPHTRGLLMNFDAEEAVWERVVTQRFGKTNLDLLRGERVVLSETPLTPKSIAEATDELIFEKFNADSLLRLSPATCVSAVTASPEGPADDWCRVVVDLGYSSTWVTPVVAARPILSSTRRLDVGGKLLTNLLKEEISFRHVDVSDLTAMVERIKIETCFVSPLATAHSDLRRGDKSSTTAPPLLPYLLPTYGESEAQIYGRVLTQNEAIEIRRADAAAQSSSSSGNKRSTPRTILRLGAERFVVPEVLFDPSRIGMPEAGLPEVIAESIASLPVELAPRAFHNVVLTGGGALIPGLKERLEAELQSFAPEGTTVRVSLAVVRREDAPALAPSNLTVVAGMRAIVERDAEACAKMSTTRLQYFERGFVA